MDIPDAESLKGIVLRFFVRIWRNSFWSEDLYTWSEGNLGDLWSLGGNGFIDLWHKPLWKCSSDVAPGTFGVPPDRGLRSTGNGFYLRRVLMPLLLLTPHDSGVEFLKIQSNGGQDGTFGVLLQFCLSFSTFYISVFRSLFNESLSTAKVISGEV